jgi:hypothetical protein
VVDGFEGRRAEIAEDRMSAPAIVEALDELEDRRRGLAVFDTLVWALARFP